MKYFLPDWDDRVDPGFHFKTDKFSVKRTPRDDIYAHDLFEEKVYDGILVSRMALGEKGRKREEVEKIGLRKYLNLPEDYELMGDCGAFGYIKQERPPFDTNHIINYYNKMGVDLAVSVDHIVIPAFADQNEARYKITIDNALEFLSESKRRQVNFTPIGAVQGWDIHTYTNAAKTLADAGYDYLAIGGLARSTNPAVIRICTEIAKAVPGVKLHVFGVGRANLASIFTSIGIASVDSSSPLRQAWLAAKDNYYTEAGAYAAIRIPNTKQERGKKHTPSGRSGANMKDLVKAEEAAISAVREYAAKLKGQTLRKTLKVLRNNEILLAKYKREKDAQKHEKQKGNIPIDNQYPLGLEADTDFTREQKKIDDYIEMYRDTLKARPWDKCPCPICIQLGVEVIIFRGSNRNRRRGFHNLWTLRQRIKAATKRSEVS